MSRIGKQPVPVPSDVKVSVADRKVTVEGPKGTLEHTFPAGVSIALEDNVVNVERDSDLKMHRAFHGMTRALIANMVKGVKEPFTKDLEIHGTGYSAVQEGDTLVLDIGFTNKINIPVPQGIEIKIRKGRPVEMTLAGPDKQVVGQLAAIIRSKRPPSPYGDNKGIRYRGETIRKKAGKAFGDKK